MTSGVSIFAPTRSSVQVLLVEDSPSDARLVFEALRESSEVRFEITHVSCLAAALEHLSGHRTDAVILDLGLADSTGINTLLKVYEADPRVPIVVLTGLRDEGLASWAMKSGAQDYLPKEQMEGRLLAHSICHAIERHQLHTQLDEIRQQQLEDQRLKSLEMMAGGIAHDFNNLLTIILGKAELARNESKPVAVRAALDQIGTAGHRAADLCGQLLAYSGGGRLEVQPANLSEVVEEMAPFFRRSIPRNVSLKWHLPRSVPCVDADVGQLRQLIMNLFLNAFEAIGDDSGTITLATGALHANRERLAGVFGSGLPEGVYVYLEITDTGCGITPDTRARIFEPFFSTKFAGRGLGLSAVFGIVRGHKGTIEIVTEEGHGSTFRILLPASTAVKPVAPVTAIPDAVWKGKGTILVVEDDVGVREVVGEMIWELGFDVILTSDVSNAMECCRRSGTDLVLALIDVVLPEEDSDKAYDGIRKVLPNLPILLMSGSSEKVAIRALNGKEVSGFVRKPFRFMELRRRIYTALKTPVETEAHE